MSDVQLPAVSEKPGNSGKLKKVGNKWLVNLVGTHVAILNELEEHEL